MKRFWAAVSWWRRQIDGQDRWDAYLRSCRDHGHPPLTRAAYERSRADARAAVPGGRCC